MSGKIISCPLERKNLRDPSLLEKKIFLRHINSVNFRQKKRHLCTVMKTGNKAYGGIFITFEGIEGCGKTTQINLLENFLIREGYPCLLTREPGGTKIGNLIRKILLDSQNSEIFVLTELFLYLAGRAQHAKEVIEPALQKKEIVLCDRFCDATIAYQGFAQNISLKLIEDLNRLVTSGLTPDITILLDCPVEIGLKRALRRNESKDNLINEDRLEEKDFKFHQKVRSGYLKISKEQPKRVRTVDSNRDSLAIHREIYQILREKIEKQPKLPYLAS